MQSRPRQVNNKFYCVPKTGKQQKTAIKQQALLRCFPVHIGTGTALGSVDDIWRSNRVFVIHVAIRNKRLCFGALSTQIAESHLAVPGPGECPTAPTLGARRPRTTPAPLCWPNTPPCWAAAAAGAQETTVRQQMHRVQTAGLADDAQGFVNVPWRRTESCFCRAGKWTRH